MAILPFSIPVFALVAAAFVYFWSKILAFLNGTVRDIIEKAFGEKWSAKFAKFLVWLDKRVVLVKQTVQSWYDWFRQKFLRLETKYTNIGETATKTTTILVELPTGEGQQTTIEEKVDWEDLPDPVREDCILRKATSAEINEKDVIERQYQEQLLKVTN